MATYATSASSTSKAPLTDASAVGDVLTVCNLLEAGAVVIPNVGKGMESSMKETEPKAGIEDGVLLVLDASELQLAPDASTIVRSEDSPLFEAVKSDNAGTVKLLLSRGASLEGRNGNTALHYAVDYGRVDFTARLIAAGVDVNASNTRMITPLHLAVRRGRVDIAKMLLVNGKADSNKKDYSGNTPLHDAIFLDEASLAEEEPLGDEAVVEQDPEQIHVALAELLLSHGADANQENDTSGYSPLHQALRDGYERTAVVLLAHGANASEKSKFGVTPLHVAAAFDASESLWKELLVHGADPTARNDDGKTPLDLVPGSHSELDKLDKMEGASSASVGDAEPFQQAQVQLSVEQLVSVTEHAASVIANGVDGGATVKSAAIAIKAVGGDASSSKPPTDSATNETKAEAIAGKGDKSATNKRAYEEGAEDIVSQQLHPRKLLISAEQTTDETVGDSSDDVEMSEPIDEEEVIRNDALHSTEEDKRAHEEFCRGLEGKQQVDVYDVGTKEWLAAKIERVDDEGYTVHYMGWSSKCDEKIEKANSYRIKPRATKAAGAWAKHQVKIDKHRRGMDKKLTVLVNNPERLRRAITRRIESGALKKPKTPVKKKDESVVESKFPEEDLCGICGEIEDDELTDMILCDGGCLKSYHFSCLGIESAPEGEEWLCEQCRTNEQLCFGCGRNGTINEKGGVFCCSATSCGKFFHQTCVDANKMSRRAGGKAKPVGLLCWRHPDDELPKIPSFYLSDRNIDTVTVDSSLHLPWMFLPKRDPDASSPDDCHHFRLLLNIINDVRLQPPTYRKLGRSIYTFKQPKVSLEDSPMCVCKVQCGEDCINRLSFTECFGPAPTPGMKFNKHTRESNCTLGENCGNRALHQKVYPRFQKFHTIEKGWGLRLLESATAGQLVIEYVGEVINEEEKERRLLDHAKNSPEDKNMYIMELGKGEYIDARFKGSVSRFINHSCDPNCHLLKWRVKGVNRIAITALKDIEPGTELSYDYQFHTKQAMEWKCHSHDSPVKKLTKKEQLKQRKRAILQEKIQHDKETKSTGRRLSLTAHVSMGDRTTIEKMAVRTGPATRELQWAKYYHLFNLRQELRDLRVENVKREQLSVSGSTTAASSRSVSPVRLSGGKVESVPEVVKNRVPTEQSVPQQEPVTTEGLEDPVTKQGLEDAVTKQGPENPVAVETLVANEGPVVQP
uniref:Histone-lysine N-methyltransferase n=1 Tax=Phytophthora ramorum TaxID=164328 RepID=H3HAU7_PHYRM